MPHSALDQLNLDTSLVHRLREATGVSLALCGQCGACTAVCPATGVMDLAPCRLVRLAQTGFAGFDRRVLASRTIWRCTGCQACARHCPNDLDLPRAMAFFRWEAERLGWASAHGETPMPIHFDGRWSKQTHATSVG